MPGRQTLLPIASARWRTPAGVHALTTSTTDGDLSVSGDPDLLTARRAEVIDLPWVWLRQVHGGKVVTVDATNVEQVRGSSADALVTDQRGIVLAVHTADCAPVVFVDVTGSVIGVAHAGWRGLSAGVVEGTVGSMRSLGAGAVIGVIGPCICAACYEFGDEDLHGLAARYGDGVRSHTRDGAPALDVIEGVRQAVANCGAQLVVPTGWSCTACEPHDWFSHRARADSGRMATVIWMDPDD